MGTPGGGADGGSGCKNLGEGLGSGSPSLPFDQSSGEALRVRRKRFDLGSTTGSRSRTEDPLLERGRMEGGFACGSSRSEPSNTSFFKGGGMFLLRSFETSSFVLLEANTLATVAVTFTIPT
mmetsp:Transcript_1584/g.3218  ORF Transcript_1584/g.3218 Transcript_1584/m.3218 type:complete len:122 (+) Transcript_1584:736-1101(+)